MKRFCRIHPCQICPKYQESYQTAFVPGEDIKEIPKLLQCRAGLSDREIPASGNGDETLWTVVNPSAFSIPVWVV
jgi:hypothetical protein